MKKQVLFFFFLFCLLFDAQAQDWAAIPNQWIVQLNDKAQNFPDFVKVKDTLSRSMKIYLLEKTNGDFSQQEFEALKKQPFVAVLQYNHRVQKRSIVPNDSLFNMQWNFQNTGQSGGVAGADISATQAWEINHAAVTQQGDSIVIAIVDDPMDLYHPDINYFINHNEIDSNGIDDDGNGYIDDYRGWDALNNTPLQTTNNISHGTHVAGIAAAKGNNGIGVTGTCWGAKILPISGSTDNEAIVLRSYDYVIEMRKLYDQTNGAKGAFIVATNSSFGVDRGLPSNFPIWCALYDSMGKVGILSATATANSNWDIDAWSDMPTACPSEYMISVTGTTRTDVKGSSMAYGPATIDIAAPGSQVFSTIPMNLGGYGTQTGTSMASPHIAGAVASMYATACSPLLNNYFAYPDSFALVFRNFLFNGVDTLPALQGKLVTNGRLNLRKTLQNVQAYQCCDFDFEATVVQPVCGDSTTGSISLNSDSVLSFVWSSGDTATEISGKNAGIYTVTASDGTCEIQRSFHLEEPQNEIVIDSINVEITCDVVTYLTKVYAHSLNGDSLSYALHTDEEDFPYQSGNFFYVPYYSDSVVATISIRNEEGCETDTTLRLAPMRVWDCDCDWCVGINEVGQNQIHLSPNPAKNSITVSIEQFLGSNTRYAIYDINGRWIKSSFLTGKSTTVALDEMADGVYLFEVKTDAGKTVRTRFVVMK